ARQGRLRGLRGADARGERPPARDPQADRRRRILDPAMDANNEHPPHAGVQQTANRAAAPRCVTPRDADGRR
ncbi:hypothetical protein QM841_43105, partial [Rhodococcus sp. IEGM 1307]|nr:hypothetical protein [Rhodococcus sp. IEGM 1307]